MGASDGSAGERLGAQAHMVGAQARDVEQRATDFAIVARVRWALVDAILSHGPTLWFGIAVSRRG